MTAKICIGMSRQFAEKWNKTATGAGKFIYIEDDEKFGYVMRSGAFKDRPDVMGPEELARQSCSSTAGTVN